MNLKENRIKDKTNWQHNEIMEKPEEFKKFLLNLTDINYFKNLLENNIVFKKILKENDKLNDFKKMFIEFIEYEVDFDCYNQWKDILTTEFLNIIVEQIKQKEQFVMDVEKTKFVKKMKKDRNSFNFVLEHLFSFNTYQDKININEIDKNISKKEYIENVNIILNMILIIYYLFNCYGFEIEKSYDLNGETINQLLKNLRRFTTYESIESFYLNIIWMIRQYVVFQQSIESNKGE